MYSLSHSLSFSFHTTNGVVPTPVHHFKDTNSGDPLITKPKVLAVPIFNKNGEYHFEEQLGVYYDLFETTPHLAVKSESIVVGQSKHILLSDLVDETEWNATESIDRSPEW